MMEQKYWIFFRKTVHVCLHKEILWGKSQTPLPQIKDRMEKYGIPLLCAIQCHLHGEPSGSHVDIFCPQ